MEKEQCLSNWESVTTLIQHTLVQMLELDVNSEPFFELQEHFRELEGTPSPQAWQKDTYLELCPPRAGWSHKRVFETLNQQYGEQTPPVRLELLNIAVGLHVPLYRWLLCRLHATP